ncbi:hypothetical protein QE379_002620 [Sphingomonas sp. SORGH_AS 879]|nr:hypothetical protein [Sphingomonas sp. SORGH_AS_0879]
MLTMDEPAIGALPPGLSDRAQNVLQHAAQGDGGEGVDVR